MLRGLQRIPAFIENIQISIIDKYAVAALAGQFAADALRAQGLHELAHGGKTHAGVSA